VNSSEGSAAPESVFDHRPKCCIASSFTDDERLRTNGPRVAQCDGQEAAAAEPQEGFVRAHARTAATGKHKCRHFPHPVIIPDGTGSLRFDLRPRGLESRGVGNAAIDLDSHNPSSIVEFDSTRSGEHGVAA